MIDTKYKWLPHLEGAIPTAGRGKRISTYNIALEGWRRGLGLTFHGVVKEGKKIKIRYSLSNDNRTHLFSLSMGDKVTEEAFNICEDKERTKQYLSAKNVPVPQGKIFGPEHNDEEIYTYAKKLGFPLVLKPIDGNAGKGVFANIQHIDALKELLIHERMKLGYEYLIVESFIKGQEFRICVIEDKVIGALNKRPASVIGDGKHTIKQLIIQVNKARKMNPHLTSRIIKIDRDINDQLLNIRYTLKSIPQKGERVYLRTKSNLSQGGDTIDVTNELTDELKNIAINAGKAIPGLEHYGVDMIVDVERNTGTVLEVNARPDIGGHVFPVEGQPRDLAKDIVDYYFPETMSIKQSNLYFNFDSIADSLTSRAAEVIKIGSCPIGKLFSKKYIISGRVQKVGYRKWITRKARECDLHGYTRNLRNGKVEVLVAGAKEYVVNDFKDICFIGPKKARVENIQEKEWKKPLEIGFKIHTTKKEQRITILENEKIIKKLHEDKKALQKEVRTLENRYHQITHNRWWKLTYPVRYISAVLQNKPKPK